MKKIALMGFLLVALAAQAQQKAVVSFTSAAQWSSVQGAGQLVQVNRVILVTPSEVKVYGSTGTQIYQDSIYEMSTDIASEPYVTEIHADGAIWGLVLSPQRIIAYVTEQTETAGTNFYFRTVQDAEAFLTRNNPQRP